MGNDISRLVEQSSSLDGDGGASFSVANLKKKIKSSDVKTVASKLPQLTSLTITSSGLKSIPPELANSFTNCQLKELNLTNNAIKALPKGLDEMFGTLITLELAKNALKKIEDNSRLDKMSSLQRLVLDENRLHEIPDQIFSLPHLTSLHLAKNAIESIPPQLEKLQNLTQLRLNGNNLCEFSEALLKLPKLEILDLSNNQISEVKIAITESTGTLSLRALNLGHNSLKEVPKFICFLTSLTELHLDHNKITKIPNNFMELSQLQLLLLNSNKLTELPIKEWSSTFTSLTTFDVRDNLLEPATNEMVMKYGSISLLRKLDEAKTAKTRLSGRSNSLSAVDAPLVLSPRRGTDTIMRQDGSSNSWTRATHDTDGNIDAPSPRTPGREKICMPPRISDLSKSASDDSPRTPRSQRGNGFSPEAPPPPMLLVPAPPPVESSSEVPVSPRQKFRSTLKRRSSSIVNESADYYCKLLETPDANQDVLSGLREQLVYEPYSWVDAFCANKGITNLCYFLEKNAKNLLQTTAEQMTQFEALHCYKILARIRPKELFAEKGFMDSVAFTLLPSSLPSLRKIALNILIDFTKVKSHGKKVLGILESLRKFLLERKGKEEAPNVTKRERFRLLIALMGSKEEQDSDELWENQQDTGKDKIESKEEEAKERESRAILRVNTLRFINALLNVTDSLSARISIRKILMDLGLLEKIVALENSCKGTLLEGTMQQEIDAFEIFLEDDNEDMENTKQHKSSKGTKSKKTKRKKALTKRNERSCSLTSESAGSPVDKLRQVRRLNSIQNLNRLAPSMKLPGEDSDRGDKSDRDDSDATNCSDDEDTYSSTTGDTAVTENDENLSDEETDEFEDEQLPYDDYFRIKVITLGTSIQTPLIFGPKGQIIVPFDASKTVGDITYKIKAQYPEMEAIKYEWGLYLTPTDANPDGLWPDENRHCGYYDLRGQVVAEFRLKPWILKITCNATDVINTLTLTKMRFDPHRTCADAVALVRSRFPHVSAWEEYDWGLYWHKRSTQKPPASPPPPPEALSPLKKTRTRASTLSRRDKKKLEEEEQKQKEREREERERLEKQKQEQEGAEPKGMWLVDTERLAAYEGLYQTDDVLELKMKTMGLKVKILSQEAYDFMQFDPTAKIDDLLKDVAARILPEAEQRNYSSYGLYLQRAGAAESCWLQEDKKLNSYKFGPEDCLCYMLRRKPIMILVYNEKNSGNAKNEKYATFSRTTSRLFNKAQMPIYTHFPVDFMSSVSEVKAAICSKVSVKLEDYELYFKKTTDQVVLLENMQSLHAQAVEAYARLLLVKKGLFSSIEELAGLSTTGEKEEDGGKSVQEELTKDEVDESFNKLTFEDGKQEVKAGSLVALIDHLIESPIYEPEYTKAFLLTHHAFTTSRAVLTYLIKKYNACREEIERGDVPPEQKQDENNKLDNKSKRGKEEAVIPVAPPPPPSTDEQDPKAKAEKTQRRILYLLKVWVDEYFYDFYDEDQLLESLIEFLNVTMVREGGTSSALVLHQRILQSIEANTMGSGKPGRAQSTDFPPQPRIIRMGDKMSFFAADEVEIARQLTIRSYELFSAIRLFEFFGQPWSKPSTQHLAPNLIPFIEYFNTISRAVSTGILREKKIRDRVKLLVRLIRIAEELRDLGNFHLLQAMISGFNNSAVLRLQWTKARLPKIASTALTDLEQLMSMNSSFKNYRLKLASTPPPAIPYIGVCLQDLTFIEDGNRNKMDNLINFSKHKLIYGVISLLDKYQKTAYNLQRVEDIQSFLKDLPQYDDKKLYSLSLKVEPRNAGRSDIL